MVFDIHFLLEGHCWFKQGFCVYEVTLVIGFHRLGSILPTGQALVLKGTIKGRILGVFAFLFCNKSFLSMLKKLF